MEMRYKNIAMCNNSKTIFVKQNQTLKTYLLFVLSLAETEATF